MADVPGIASSSELSEHFARLYEHSPLHVVLYDPQDRVRYANPAHCADFGMARDVSVSWSDMMRHSYANSVGAAIRTGDFEAWLLSAKTRRGKLPFRTFEADLHNGRWMYITAMAGFLALAAISPPCGPTVAHCARRAMARCAPPRWTP